MPNMYEDLKTGPFEIVEQTTDKKGNVRFIKRKMNYNELKAANQQLLDGAADMAAKLEWAINTYNIPIAELEKIKAPR